jgi:hypothetical protein
MTDDELDTQRRLRPDDVLSDEAVDAAVLAGSGGSLPRRSSRAGPARASSHRRSTQGSPMRTSEPRSEHVDDCAGEGIVTTRRVRVMVSPERAADSCSWTWHRTLTTPARRGGGRVPRG